MKSIVSRIAFTLILLCSGIVSHAQFYLSGYDRGNTKWMSMDSENYRLIYPKGLDSLARVYAIQLEKWRIPTGQSAGYLPCEFNRKKYPVLLHGDIAVANGSVVWAPHRLNFNMSPEAYSPIPTPWETTLAIHEQRHVAQMQTGMTGVLKPFGWFLGEIVNGAACAAYGGNLWMEGDAVVAETALTHSGRGRMDSFLNYYMTCFDSGEWRNWYKWANESQRNYVPNHYALGYMLIAGLRYNYGTADITGEKFRKFSKNPFRWGYTRDVKELTGKRINKSFQETAETFYEIWKEEADKRAPYMKTEQIIKTPDKYCDYSWINYTDDGLYAVRSGISITPELVKIHKNGSTSFIRKFSYSADGIHLTYNGQQLLWSETISNPRWDLNSYSVIYSYDTQSRKTIRLSGKQRLYNPVGLEGGNILCIENHRDGAFSLSLLEKGCKTARSIVKAPDGLQLVECCEFEGKFYVTGLSEEGFGIYVCENGKLRCILEPQAVSMSDFGVEPDGHLHFSSDLNGVNEYYHFDPYDSSLLKLTSSRYGGNNYHYDPESEWIYFCCSTKDGHLVSRTKVSELPVKKVNFSDTHKWIIADSLSAQEASLARIKGFKAINDNEVILSTPKPYRKLLNSIRIHSWAPVYFDYDKLSNLSFDRWYDTASPGATILSQNTLGTIYGSLGYSAHPDPDGGNWRHSAHLRATLACWYPVIEARLDINDRRVHDNGFRVLTDDGKSGAVHSYTSIRNGSAYTKFSLKAYIPFNFSNKGWYRGIIPQISWNISNDTYNCSPDWYLRKTEALEDGSTKEYYELLRNGNGKSYLQQNFSASLRAYTISATSTAAVYPRLGIGLEAGYYQPVNKDKLHTTRADLSMFSPHFYLYAYGYLPGITREQGLKLSYKKNVAVNENVMFGSSMLNTLPRGLADNPDAMHSLNFRASSGYSLSADYAIPIWMSDLALGGFAYIKRLVLTPHADFSSFRIDNKYKNLFSAGIDLSLDFGTFFWLTYPMSAGIRVDYSGGKGINEISGMDNIRNRFYIAPVFNISF